MTTQTHIALQIVSTLTNEEMQMFVNELSKTQNVVVKAITKPKKKIEVPSTEVLIKEIVQNHRRKKHTEARKLA